MKISANSVTLNIVDEGRRDGPCVTFLHSLATDLTLWDEQAAALTSRFRIIRIDARGHGHSDAPQPPYSQQDFVEDVAAVWGELDVETSSLVGLSLGGMTAIGLALAYPDRIERIVAADCRLDAPAEYRERWTTRQALLRDEGMEAVVDATMPGWLTKETRMNHSAAADRIAAMIRNTSESGYLGTSAALQGADYKRLLAEVRCPVLFIAGAEDRALPSEMRQLAELVPDGRYEEIPGAAHLANIDQPKHFNRLLLEFLAPR